MNTIKLKALTYRFNSLREELRSWQEEHRCESSEMTAYDVQFIAGEVRRVEEAFKALDLAMSSAEQNIDDRKSGW